MGAMTLCVFIIVVLSKFLDYLRSNGSKLTNQSCIRSIWHIKTFITSIDINLNKLKVTIGKTFDLEMTNRIKVVWSNGCPK